MKHTPRILSLFCLFLCLSCSKDEGPEEVIDPKSMNAAPSVPVLSSPPDKMQCSFPTMTYEWEVSRDPEGTEVTYELQVSESEDFSDLMVHQLLKERMTNVNMQEGTTYYWRVRAIDPEGLMSDFSEIRSISTAPELSFNYIPSPPELQQPTNNALLGKGTILLEWTCTDSDGDPLLYDLYLSTSRTPDLLKADLTANSIEIELEEEGTYYWKIIAKDNKGAKAIGILWSFNL